MSIAIHTLGDIALARIDRVIVTATSGAVSIMTSPQLIAAWLAKHGATEVEWRPEYGGWCSVKSGVYKSFCVKVRP